MVPIVLLQMEKLNSITESTVERRELSQGCTALASSFFFLLQFIQRGRDGREGEVSLDRALGNWLMMLFGNREERSHIKDVQAKARASEIIKLSDSS